MRSPRAAASTMAVRGIGVWRLALINSGVPWFRHGRDILRHRRLMAELLRLRWRLRHRHVFGVPILQGLQRRMRQRPLQIGPYAGDVSKILRLAIALVEPGKDTQDF